MMNELLRLYEIHAANERSALHGADFRLFRGESVSLLGGYHAGKSMLIDIITGREIPASGSRFINGCRVAWDVRPSNLRVKVLRKNFGLIGQMTIWENLSSYPLTKGRSFFLRPDKIKEEINHLLKKYSVGAEAVTAVDQLTNVQKLAVALIKARFEHIDLVIVDDAELEYSYAGYVLMKNLMQISREQGMVLLFIGINAGWISQMSDRVCYLENGVIFWEEDHHGTILPQYPSLTVPVFFTENIHLQKPPHIPLPEKTYHLWNEEFSLSGKGGELIMLIDPDNSLKTVFPDKKLEASLVHSERKPQLTQVDFFDFDKLVRWMSPSENMALQLSNKVSRRGILPPHMKEYLLNSYIQWSGDDEIRHASDCENLRIWERIRIAAFCLKMARPDILVFRHYRQLDQRSQDIVAPVLSELLQNGTLIVAMTNRPSISEKDSSVDGYYLMHNGSCSGRMEYAELEENMRGSRMP